MVWSLSLGFECCVLFILSTPLTTSVTCECDIYLLHHLIERECTIDSWTQQQNSSLLQSHPTSKWLNHHSSGCHSKEFNIKHKMNFIQFTIQCPEKKERKGKSELWNWLLTSWGFLLLLWDWIMALGTDYTQRLQIMWDIHRKQLL